jgi:hypothetical protein
MGHWGSGVDGLCAALDEYEEIQRIALSFDHMEDGKYCVTLCEKCAAAHIQEGIDEGQCRPAPSDEQSDELRGIVEEMEQTIQDYQGNKPYHILVGEEALDNWRERLARIADKGECRGCDNAPTWCDECAQSRPADSRSAPPDIDINLSGNAGPDEHTRNLIEQLRDAQKRVIELEDNPAPPAEVWVCRNLDSGRTFAAYAREQDARKRIADDCSGHRLVGRS